MKTTTTVSLIRLAAALLFVVSAVASPGVSAAHVDAERMALERRYSTAHSLGENYTFDPRDGWETVNTTNLAYKYNYPRGDGDTVSDLDVDGDYLDDTAGNGYDNGTLVARAKKTTRTKAKKKAAKTSGGSTASKLLKGGLDKVMSSFKGIGKPEPVVITWYTGHDLLNPSCWSNPTWAPTDKSFAAALTLDGWTNKPKCFKFLELCHTPQKCVFVRVVDSCAGCAKGSKHVDLTQSAFKEMADLDVGILQVQMRPATDPSDGWLKELWGPKADAND
ncbi:hypothetical protein L226DRAFT_608312 [Lentinus tigrinus ALCF2SS1-7]|uniref:RlpA-like protein double-psi beta-barrel domain-containing protein n=1 Tax=Lentinus tigrinus ALCF2SS1-6 TaxID=1328759 RepID=A0A5C2STA2_9APHY|nr:hypothetical protein L227DRAFT_605478 [Lentinus tigrinus ALCF2SS1-6]RPD81005.1 hypothetical protein L226DRAFT_608312 [Lentinus tigrinus ALCF2SS1-7]